MPTYGGLVEPDRDRKIARRQLNDESRVEFRYTEPFANHFDYRHAVDDSNNLRHTKPSFEETWRTHRWVIRALGFVIALCEVNTFCAMRYFVWSKKKDNSPNPTFLQFRRELSMQLLHNTLDKDTDGVDHSYAPSPRRCSPRKDKELAHEVHELKTAPKYAQSWNFPRRRWDCTAKNRYQQYICRGKRCRKQVRSYCVCNMTWLCKTCHTKHVIEELTSNSD